LIGADRKWLARGQSDANDPIRTIIANPEVESCYSSGLPAANVPGRNRGNRQSDRWSNEAIYRRVAGPHRSTARLRVDNQYPSRIEAPHVGVLCSACAGPGMNTFWEELRKLGWVEGTTIVIERKEAGTRLDQLPALAAELVQSKPDLIVATSPQSARAAKDATSEIPTAFFWVADPVGMGLASSLAHPGGNVTGAATLVPGDFNGKVLGIIRELLPRAKRVAALVNPLNESVKLLI
jgi:hypothetical protein